MTATVPESSVAARYSLSLSTSPVRHEANDVVVAVSGQVEGLGTGPGRFLGLAEGADLRCESEAAVQDQASEHHYGDGEDDDEGVHLTVVIADSDA
ncbi:hypothetical protein ACRJ4B_11825 [Streptomyces sp. GTA36]